MKILQFSECIVFCSFYSFAKEIVNYVLNCQGVGDTIDKLIEVLSREYDLLLFTNTRRKKVFFFDGFLIDILIYIS